MRYPRPNTAQLGVAVLAMGLVVLSSNILVQYAINDWLTWGAITYPFAFLVTELVNRAFGPAQARRVAWVGFAVAVAASAVLAPPRIAAASGLAFCCRRCSIFPCSTSCATAAGGAHRWQPRHWRPCWTPRCSGAWPLPEDLPWITWALGDLGVKLLMAVCLLLPFRLLIGRHAQTNAPV